MSLTEIALLGGRRPLPLWDKIGLTFNFNPAISKMTGQFNDILNRMIEISYIYGTGK
jgi:hypothetical protein